MITEERKKKFLETYKHPIIALALHKFCSHQCWYCCDGHKNPQYGDKLSIIDSMGVDNYIKKILELAKVTTHYRINGGEPFENKYIKEISFAILNEGHFISFLSNLTHVDNVYETCLPNKKQVRMEASFHLGAYLRDKTPVRLNNYLNDYFIKATQISYKTDIVLVLSRDVLNYSYLYYTLDKMKEIGKSNDCDVQFAFQEMYGMDIINEKSESFPTAYDQEDKEKIVALNRYYKDPNYQFTQIEAVAAVNRVLKLKGWDCFYMKRILDISSEGRVMRCNSGFPAEYEDLETTQYTLNDESAPCIYDSCNCIGRGIKACLTPNGVTLEDYVKNNNI